MKKMMQSRDAFKQIIKNYFCYNEILFLIFSIALKMFTNIHKELKALKNNILENVILTYFIDFALQNSDFVNVEIITLTLYNIYFFIFMLYSTYLFFIYRAKIEQ